jgi:hypothetical protein
MSEEDFNRWLAARAKKWRRFDRFINTPAAQICRVIMEREFEESPPIRFPEIPLDSTDPSATIPPLS